MDLKSVTPGESIKGRRLTYQDKLDLKDSLLISTREANSHWVTT